jgi:hypothetical protein
LALGGAETPIFTAMRKIVVIVFAVLTAFSTPACSKKSGCPAETAQTKVDKNGEYKASKTKSGLLPKTKHYNKKKGTYKHKKVKHKI